MGRRHEQLLGLDSLLHVSLHAARLHTPGSVWVLRGAEHRRVRADFLLLAGNQATVVGGIGLCLCGAD